MSKAARIALAGVTALLISSGYGLFNMRHLARTLGYDEVYYLYWVDTWDRYPMYYPQHLLFVPTSVLFQKHFSGLTGITNTAFIQKFKNILVVSLALGLFFLIFYGHSRRFWLSLIFALLIGISGSLWHDVQHHETSAIPGVLINLAVLLLLFYRRFPYPTLFIVPFAALNAFAILLHQAYLFSIIAVFFIFLFTRPRTGIRSSLSKNLFRSSLYLLLVLAMVGGTYYYIGFVKLNLRLQDNPQGTQRLLFFENIPIRGNFIRFFYLIRAREKWGRVRSSSLEQAIDGYGSSFMTTFRADKVNLGEFAGEAHLSSNVVSVALAAFLAGFALLFIPVFRRYGMLYPGLLLWLAIGSAFVYWWEPGYIEHWIYLTILTWVLVFLVCTALIELAKPGLPRAAVYLCLCIALLTFASVMYRENFTHTILVQEKPFVPASVRSAVWKEEYRMDEMYRNPAAGGTK